MTFTSESRKSVEQSRSSEEVTRGPKGVADVEDDYSIFSTADSVSLNGTSVSSDSRKKGKRRKWGQVPVHAAIKRWEGAKDLKNVDNTGNDTEKESIENKNNDTEKESSDSPSAKRTSMVLRKRLNKHGQPEDVGEFIKREIRNYETGENRPVEYQTSEAEKKREEFAKNLHNTLLQTQVHELGFDIFRDRYNPSADSLFHQSNAMNAAEAARAAADTGPSISKERFSSKYWSTWRRDIMILERESAREAAPIKKVLTREEVFQQKLKKLGVSGGKPNSSLPGISFAVPKEDRSKWFDFHMMGNRNDPKKLLVHSKGEEVPTYEKLPSKLVRNADPHETGKAVKGGVMQQGPRLPKGRKPLTSNADTPAVFASKGDAKLTSFGRDRRTSHLDQGTSGGASYEVRNGEIGTGDTVSKIGFAREKREGVPDSRASYPGPGAYDIPGFTSHHPKKDYSELIAEIEKKEGGDYRMIEAHDIGKLGGFMQGCDRQEHILYGFCLDGLCGKRTKFEKAFLQTKNHKRLGAESAETCQAAVPAKYSASFEGSRKQEEKKPVKWETHSTPKLLLKEYSSPEKIDKLRREWIESSVPDPKMYMYPLHLAARRGDVHAIRKMAVLGLDINFVEGDRQETPLQMAVRGQHLDAVNAILDEFDGLVDLDVQNLNGDTALHIATRKGWTPFVEVLCGADANPLLKNLNGLTALKEAHLFSIQQLLRMQEEVFNLRKELQETKNAVEEQIRAEEDRVAGSLTLDTYLASPDNSAVSHALARAGGQANTSTVSAGDTSRATSSKARPRSRLLELQEDTYDKELDDSKVNKSLFRVERKTFTLRDPKKNSFVLGYWPDDDLPEEEKQDNGTFKKKPGK